VLRILGSPKRLCEGWNRREMLRAGGLGLIGLSLPDFFRLTELQANQPRPVSPAKHFGRAKSVILIHLYGAHSQLETFDPKPAAPVEVRGELKSIRSALPGLDVCELLPHLAKVTDRVTVIRSMTHPYPLHGVAFATTGVPAIDVPMELNPRDPRHWPYIGSVVDYLARRDAKRPPDLPANIFLPWPFSTRRIGEVARAGPYGAFLGGAYNPLWCEFAGKATRRVVKVLNEQRVEFAEPYRGITPESRFELATATELPTEITLDRLDSRRSLAEQFDRARRDLRETDAGRSVSRYREMAYNLIGSARVRAALDVGREPLPLRESYGMTVFGQACLAARRLTEAGSRFVSVFWDEFGLAGSGWDTHWDHYPRMKDELLPGLDLAFSGLIADLDARGLLDETLVLLLSEHGRTPKIQNVRGGGRDHWSQCYSIVMAGAGVARGRVVGRSDKIAGTVAERPVSPKDVLATTYHLLGIDPLTTLTDRAGRPLPLVADGSVLNDVLT
jgi:hypothetical protein